METLIVNLHDMVQEVKRIMRFLKLDNLHVDSLNGLVIFRHPLIVKYKVEETKHDFSAPRDIEYQRAVERLELFPFSPARDAVIIRGTLLILTRNGYFVEIEILGERNLPSLFPKEDVIVDFKNPVERDLSYIAKTYSGVREELIAMLKRAINYTVYCNEKKLYNLSRIIKFLKEMDAGNASNESHEIEP